MPGWITDALCQHFPEMAWIAEPEGRTPTAAEAMGVVCAACPVRESCEQYADQAGITSGFWAGADRTPVDELGESGAA